MEESSFRHSCFKMKLNSLIVSGKTVEPLRDLVHQRKRLRLETFHLINFFIRGLIERTLVGSLGQTASQWLLEAFEDYKLAWVFGGDHNYSLLIAKK